MNFRPQFQVFFGKNIYYNLFNFIKLMIMSQKNFNIPIHLFMHYFKFPPQIYHRDSE